MPGAGNAETSVKTIKKFFILFLVFLLSVGYFTFAPVRQSVADQNSPPDESVTDNQPSEEVKAAAKRAKEEAARRERQRKAAVARKAREKAKLDAKKAAEEAAEAKRRMEEEMARAAREEMIRRTLEVSRNLMESGRFQSAINMLTGFLDANPRSAEAWYLIARARHALGDYDKAQIASNIALEIDPHYPELAKTPSGLEPRPYLTKGQRKEPRPSMSVLPVKPPLPANLPLEPVVISFPFLVKADGTRQESVSDPAAGAYLQYVPYPPEPRETTVAWMQSERWNEISRWRFRADRMGILMEPRVPIAWKGSRPYEVYFWTGGEWARVRRKYRGSGEKETYDDILYSAQESIAEVLNDRGFVWRETDTPSLAAAASLMRYKWMGSVDLTSAASRAEKRARECYAPVVSDDVKKAENF
ncbi:MAG: tetratricopeptide repeat protein [Synergistaceae bacterium]|jgi:tetratricopeptide (TPR) repeat protein|nr:tetratricopeptide repeat protein [Synergistaceae bacterium]